jgi:uncharacterized membrane protein YhhN
MKNPSLLTAFWALVVANLAAILFQWQPVIYLTKPLLLTTLAFWFFIQTKNSPSKFRKFMLTGLICSIAGDIFLMFAQEQFFLFGLGSFMLAHVSYITAFSHYPSFKNGAVCRQPLLALPLLLFLPLMSWYLWNDLPAAFKIPVLAYSSVITLMALSSQNMRRRVAKQTAQLLLLGALLFVLSDSFIAVEKFKTTAVSPLFMRFSIMSTYLAGQFLLAKGSILATKEV